MKRYLTIFLALIWLTATCFPAFAAVECTVPKELTGGTTAPDVPMIGGKSEEKQPVNGKYATMGDLYQAWGGYEGYPDYVCGVWSTDGGMSSLTVAVTKDEAGENGKEEILSLLENSDTVTFTYQSYSYKELLEVNNAIVERMMAGGSPIVACGIYEMENKVHVSVLESAEEAEKTVQELVKTYGDKVTVELGSMIFDTTMGEARDRGVSGTLLVLAAAVALIGIIAAAKCPARLTSTGKVVTDRSMGRRQVEKLGIESTEIPSERSEEQIKKQI